jgi:hypothetical protein
MSQRRPPRTPDEEDRRKRRLEALEALQQAAELRARMHPRQRHLARARALLHARTTRG